MRIECEFGLRGLEKLAPGADVVVIVDVLSFSTCIDVAVGRGAKVFPHPMTDAAAAYASARNAALAGKRRDPEAVYTLSPATLTALSPGERLVLPSPNGSTLSAAARGPTLAGCLRNAKATAVAAMSLAAGGRVAVIAAGERWPDGSLRPAIEDLIGAGAIIAALDGDRSAEADIAVAAYERAAGDLANLLSESVSGQELIEAGFPTDVAFAAALNVSDRAASLRDGGYEAS